MHLRHPVGGVFQVGLIYSLYDSVEKFSRDFYICDMSFDMYSHISLNFPIDTSDSFH